MTFEEKVRSMTPYELVMAMINGLRNKYCEVDMKSFGRVEDNVCYGCAATNAIQEIAGVKFTPDNIDVFSKRAKAISDEMDLTYFLGTLEDAFDYLRQGGIEIVNYCLTDIGCQTLPIPEDSLPILTNKNYKENLQAYEKYAEEIR